MSESPMMLKVLEAYTRDVGRGVARVDYEVMDSQGLSTGDVIEIKGKRRTVAKCLPLYPTDEGRGIIRMDGLIRNNSGVAIGDNVAIRKIRAGAAERVIITPLEDVPFIDERYITDALEGMPVTKGDNVMVPYFGGRITFNIVSVSPAADAVIINQKTTIQRSGKGGELKGVPRVTYEDIGGLKDEIQKIREMVELPLRHPELFEKLGIEPPTGVMLYGPPGTGKTLLAKAVANETNAHFIHISGPEIMSKFYGESEARLREKFNEAKEKSPSIIFIDEIDSIAPKREEVTGEVERRVVSQLLTLMDGLEGRGKVVVIGATNRPNSVDPALRRPGRFDREIELKVPDKNGRLEILQIHSRNMPLDPGIDIESERLSQEAINSLGNFEMEMDDYFSALKENGAPEASTRLGLEALRKCIPNINIDSSRDSLNGIEVNAADFITAIKEIGHNDAAKKAALEAIKKILPKMFVERIAKQTHGFVGADLEYLCKEAGMKALKRILPKINLETEQIPTEILNSIRVIQDDFQNAFKEITPSAMREVYVETPDIKWSDIGGLDEIKVELREAVEWPLKFNSVYKKIGYDIPKGILLYGASGTGKTLLAKAVANESEANFISVRGPELLSKWVGESEKAVREVFRKARQASPCIIFFDEIDSLAPTRGMSSDSGVTERVVSQLLTELDGMQPLSGVVVIAATNRLDMLDPSLLRAGRFDKLIMVPLPDRATRAEIFKIHLRGKPISSEVSPENLASQTDGFSGADIASVVNTALSLVLQDYISKHPTPDKAKVDLDYLTIRSQSFEEAIKRVKASRQGKMIEKIPVPYT